MSKKKKKKQQSRKNEATPIGNKPPDQEVLDSIGSPNAWTPSHEDAWLKELRGISAGEIYRRFPPIKKPPNVGRRGKGSGWGEND